MSIMPGIEARAPERTETNNGWLSSAKVRPCVSTLDLCGPGFAVVRGAAGPAGREAYHLSTLRPDEAMLVRPDQVVAWRGPATQDLGGVLARVTAVAERPRMVAG